MAVYGGNSSINLPLNLTKKGYVPAECALFSSEDGKLYLPIGMVLGQDNGIGDAELGTELGTVLFFCFTSL